MNTADSIKRLDQSTKGLALLFCVDVSGSMKKAVLKEIQDALVGLLTDIRTQNNYGLISFADKVIIESDLTNNRDTLIESIRGLEIRGKKTVLYRAIFESLDKLEQDMPNEYRRILVISDGKNEHSESSFVTLDTIIDLSKEYGIPIDAIGHGIIDKQYSDGLKGLAKNTGGRFIRVQPDSTSLRNAIRRMHKTLMETTWVINFRYDTKAEQPAVENAVIKFERNHSLSFNAIIDQSIPRPVSKSPFWENKLFLFFASVLLFLITLFFILRIIRRRKIPDDDEEVETPSGSEEQFTTPITPPDHPQVRQTMAGSFSSPNPQINQNQPPVSLEVINGSLKGQHIVLDKQYFRIGADQDNDLVLADDDFVSGNHVLLSYDNDKLLLTDQNSLNGTLLNGENISDKTLQVFPGDEIQIGNSSFRIMEF